MRIKAMLGMAVVASLVIALGPAGASASTVGRELRGLRHASCPAPYELTGKTFSGAEVEDARVNHRFNVGSYLVVLTPPVDWLQDPFQSQHFRNFLAGLTWTAVLLYDYRKGDLGALKQARDLMLDWARRQPLGGANTSSNAWHAKIVGDRAGYLAYMTRAAACERVLSQRDALTMLRQLQAHADWLLQNPSTSNRGLFDSFNLLLLGRELPFMPDSRRWRRVGRERFLETFHARIVEHDGVWLENSTKYHLAVTNVVRKFVRLEGRDRRGPANVLARMKDVSRWLVEPDQQLVQWGDSDLTAAGDKSARRAARDHGLLALLDSGLAVFKEPGAFLSVFASFFTGTHKHSDDLSFDLYDRGHRIVSDTGEYDQDQGGTVRGFVVSAFAHSTLTVDGQDLSRSGRSSYGSGLVSKGKGDGWHAIEARNPLLERQEVTHRRLFLYKPGVALVVVDSVRSAVSHTYDRYFQLGPDIGIDDLGPQELGLQAQGFDGSLYSESTVGAETRSTVRGSEDPLGGWTSPDFRELDPRWTVKLDSAGADVDYVTTISLDPTELRAHLGSVGEDVTTLTLTSHGAAAGTLKVQRQGSRLAVTQQP